MPNLTASPRNRALGLLADAMASAKTSMNSVNVPLLGPLGDLILAKATNEVNDWSYGNSPFTMPASGVGGYIPVTKNNRRESLADVVNFLAGVDVAKPVVQAAGRAAKTALNPMTYGRAFMEAQAPAVMSNVIEVGSNFAGKKVPAVEKLAKNKDKFLYHSSTADKASDIKYGLEPQQPVEGTWVNEVLQGTVDDVGEIVDRSTPLAWMGDSPSWVKIMVARKLGKPIDKVTAGDIENHGYVAMFNKKAPDMENVYRVGEEGLMNGPYSVVTDLKGNQMKAYETPIFSDGMEPFGVERNEYITTDSVEPFINLTGKELVDFLRQSGALKGLLD